MSEMNQNLGQANEETQVEIINPFNQVDNPPSETQVMVTTDDGFTTYSQLSLSQFENPTSGLYSSIQITDRNSAIRAYNAVRNSEHSLKDMVGEVLEITDMVAHPIQLVDEQTGELTNAMRTVLVDVNGVGYHAVSQGVVQSLVNIISIVGHAPWTEPLRLTPRRVKTRRNFETTTLRLLADDEDAKGKKVSKK